MLNIVVAGGSGFIGREIVKLLIKRKYNILVVDVISPPKDIDSNKIEFKKVDLCDGVATAKVFKNANICINLAAKIGGVGYINKYPATILSENNKIYSSTFEAAVKNKLQRMVYVSSSMVFEATDKFPSLESDVVKIPPPISSYGFSKLIGETYCKAFWDQFGLAFSICRPFNAYGLNEYPREEIGYAHVIPDMVKKIISGQYPLEILGDGNQIRCFTHVKDLAEGIVKVTESKNGINEDFNIANPRPVKITDLASILWKISGRKEKLKLKRVQGFRYDIKKRIPDTSKAKKLIGWEAKINLEEGLKETYEWLKERINEKYKA